MFLLILYGFVVIVTSVSLTVFIVFAAIALFNYVRTPK